MNTNEILEGNKLIAEFMGYIDNGCSEEGYLINPITNYDEDISELKYHSSFDWLMPVVEKIETELNLSLVIYPDYVYFTGGVDEEPPKELRDDFNGEDGTRISAIYKAVIAGIKYINKNK